VSDIRVEPQGEPTPQRPPPRASWLRERWRQPPYGVVAVASALVGGAAVAVYMDRPVEIVEPGPAPLQLNRAPESWLNVAVDDNPAPTESGEELDLMLARHPADATLTEPLELYQENLVALPPGTYQVRAACSAETVAPPDRGGPAWFTIDIIDPTDYEPAPESSTGRDPADLVCDGEPHTVSTGMPVTGYQAFLVSYYTALHRQAENEDEPMGVVIPGVHVAVSFTPVR
jgi:hypothetical protein